MDILFFASFRERLQCDREHWEDLSGHQTIMDILTSLRDRGEPWASVLADEKSILVSRNQEMSKLETEVGPDDEIAFFPPVTGG